MNMLKSNTYTPLSIDYDDFSHCPQEYRDYVIRILAIQAFAEKAGANEMGGMIKHAPDAKSRMGLAKIVYDEANHAYLLYTILEKLGISEEEAVAIAQSKNTTGKATQSLEGVMAVGDEENEWLDLVLNNMFLDRAGSFMVSNFAESSFKPWAIACKKIYDDEQWHKAFGFKQLKKYLESGINKNVEDKILKWYVYALNFFGPPNVKSQEVLRHYGIKRASNEELRLGFKQEVLQALSDIGLQYLATKNLTNEYPYQIVR
jgi:ring-1,2-phenylacetyl-CoA epoxidase subunit PaaA